LSRLPPPARRRVRRSSARPPPTPSVPGCEKWRRRRTPRWRGASRRAAGAW
jgi:hypothetical protein